MLLYYGGGSASLSVIQHKNHKSALPLQGLNWHTSTKPRAIGVTARGVCVAIPADVDASLVSNKTLIVANSL